MELFRLDVFTRTPGQGNPTGLVLKAESLSNEEMQAIAARLEVEMAFVLPPQQPEANLRLRYFSPATEMNLCGHATIGALWLLGEQGQLKGKCGIETLAGVLSCQVEFENGQLQRALMGQPIPTFEEIQPDRAEVAQALGLPRRTIGGPLVAASTGRPKLLIPLPDYTTLDAIRLDSATHAALCQRYGLTGLYPYTLTPRNKMEGVTAEARQFPYGIGLHEDPVTGVAMAALSGWLLQSGAIAATSPETRLLLEQGHAMGRPGRAEIRLRHEDKLITQVQLGGQAIP